MYLSISEINIDSASTPAKRYIELHMRSIPDRTPKRGESLLNGWRLLMIKGTTMELVMSIDLSIYRPEPEDSFVVIGDRTVPRVNVRFDDDRTAISFTPMSFPDFDSSPFAIVLMAAVDPLTSEAFRLPGSNGTFQSIPLRDDDFRLRIISDLVWDVAVVGRRAPTNQCDFFTSLFPTGSFPEDLKYLLRDRDLQFANSSVTDYSLNYCCQKPEPFSPWCFKLGHPSPGM